MDLVRVEGILSDVNTVTGTGARVTDAVSGAVEHAASGVAGVAAKVAGKVTGKQPSKLSAHDDPASLEAPKDAGAPVAEGAQVNVEQVCGDTGYFTYPAAAQKPEDAAAERPADSENE